SLGGLPSKDQLVARLVVTRLSRRTGRRRYEAVIEARERVYDALAQRLQTAPRSESDPLRAAAAVARALSVEVVEQPPKTPPPAGGPPIPVRAGTQGLRALADLEQAMVACYGKAGRGVYLIRDGALHVGPGRPVPL